jgi:hypothetical protein
VQKNHFRCSTVIDKVIGVNIVEELALLVQHGTGSDADVTSNLDHASIALQTAANVVTLRLVLGISGLEACTAVCVTELLFYCLMNT